MAPNIVPCANAAKTRENSSAAAVVWCASSSGPTKATVATTAPSRSAPRRSPEPDLRWRLREEAGADPHQREGDERDRRQTASDARRHDRLIAQAPRRRPGRRAPPPRCHPRPVLAGKGAGPRRHPVGVDRGRSRRRDRREGVDREARGLEVRGPSRDRRSASSTQAARRRRHRSRARARPGASAVGPCRRASTVAVPGVCGRRIVRRHPPGETLAGA